MPATRGEHKLMGQAIKSFLSIPDSKSRLVTIEPSGSVRYLRVYVGGNSILMQDSELQQLFDLIVEKFSMHQEYPLKEFVGDWFTDLWGTDPR